MERFLQRYVQRLATRFVSRMARKGVSSAIDKGGEAWSKRRERKVEAKDKTIEALPSEGRRRLLPDERRGDDVLYPTDEFSEELQPRR